MMVLSSSLLLHMNQSKTLVIDDAVPFAKEMFASLGNVITLPGKEISAQDVRHADALIVRSRTQVNASLLANSQVKFVGSTVVGLDHIDQTYLTQQNIQFYSAQGCNANSVAEYVITNLLNLAEIHGFQLSEKSIAIIGVGHVGKLVEQKAHALNMTVYLNDPPRQRTEHSTQFVDLDTALTADIITLHTPLTFDGIDKTYQLINAQKLSRIQPHQIIINAARGGIINEAAWTHTPTLNNIIDCWENEPYIDEALYNIATIATPHIAGHALDAKIAGSEMVYHALCQHWQQTPKHNWHTALPAPPAIVSSTFFDPNASLQRNLQQLCAQCYQPQQDDLAIRTSNIDTTHKKYEYYRRHYPEHREWHQYKVEKTNNQSLNKALLELGFDIVY